MSMKGAEGICCFVEMRKKGLDRSLKGEKGQK